ncbi:MAG: hypothetical protein QOJ97_1910 [Solirubrobacteraceae bacterium]|nr:hypothetical protein [Solirubrobacteraceae bacterium]
MNRVKIFVRLLDEAVDVWRPISAEQLDNDRYRIVEQAYDRDIEKWEFEPGETVLCEFVDSSDGRILAVVGREAE